MNDAARWLDANTRYLATALADLRARLERLASGPPHAPASQAINPADAALAPSATGACDAFDAAEALDTPTDGASLGVDPSAPPALIMLRDCFGLSRFEQNLLLLCVAMELDTRIAELCARAQHAPHRPYPTFALALALFEDGAWDALSPNRPLRRACLIDVQSASGQASTGSALSADERIVAYVKGLNYLDERLMALLAPLNADDADAALPPSQQACVDDAMQACQRALNMPIPAAEALAIQLLGTHTQAKKTVAAHMAHQFGRQLYVLSADALPDQPAALDVLAKLWQREVMLLPIGLYIDLADVDSAHESRALATLRRFIGRGNSLVFVDTRELLQRFGHTQIALDVRKPTPAEQELAWREALGPCAGAQAGVLAAQFELDLATIRAIAPSLPDRAATGNIAPTGHTGRNRSDRKTGSTGSTGSTATSADAIWDACRAAARPGLDGLAQRIDVKAGWDDIVLPDETAALLRQIVAQVRGRSTVYQRWGFAHRMNRGFGISALFTGDSGTGKTMAAEVIAGALRLDLFRIDLSTVVSKYIGETERNLRRLFDAAEGGGAILFFDECDALFGKRSEVKDSHDRYANIEINYLLQRIEAYRGLAILATNLKSSLDTAFVRRLRFIVTFSFPGTEERRAIWQKVFPRETPTAILDYERLARLSLSGGNIHSAALNGAFLAAQAGTPVNMASVLEAVRTELVKLGRPVNEADFRLVKTRGTGS